jgi:RimJ/RimL family protein N-acetyltransferase
MRAPPRADKKELWFRCGRYFLRTARREDASERWAGWLSDPWTVHVLNSAPRAFTKSDVVDYIKQFDQRQHCLLAIFEMGTRLHVGFVRLDFDATSDVLVNAVIGEASHRNRGATTDVFVALLDFLFDTVGVERVRASVLLRNEGTLAYLLKLGWQKDEAPRATVTSVVDGSPLATCMVSWTRAGYKAFRQTPIGGRILRRLSSAEHAAVRKPGRTTT